MRKKTMEMELTDNMTGVVEKIVGYTPKEIKNMSIEEIEKHVKVARKKNKLFHKFFSRPVLIKSRGRKYKFSDVSPRGSMIAANHRFTFRDETNKKIMKIK